MKLTVPSAQQLIPDDRRMKRTIIAFASVCILIVTGAHADNGSLQNPALKKFYSEIRRLVLRYYPKASSELLRDTIHFEYDTRAFIVHEPLKTGEWQDPWEERGPKPGGILCDLVLRKGKYGGQAKVPQKFDKRYFTVWLLAPYSAKHDCYLYVHLYYPGDVNAEFLKQFGELVRDFEKHLD